MKINVLQILKNFQGIVIQNEKNVDLTLRAIFTNGLLTSTKRSQQETGELKYARYQLATLINTEDEPEITLDELKQLRVYVGEVYSPVVVGATWDFIDKLTKAPQK